jgi:lipopolysaccharide/colanic/teichoic acid biosynthesis glycosyltransferase
MKRIIDLFIVLLASPIILCIIILVSGLVYFNLGRPIFFTQPRGGLNGRVFKIWKFRSMTNATDRNGRLLTDAERLTKIGLFLRSSSLDEFPSFFNILKGDMSLIGPRPLIADYLTLYTLYQSRRHEVRPGITGWAQVNGRNAISWEEKFQLDIWYIENRNLWLDMKIFWLTLRKIFIRDGINADGEATMPRFTGSPPTSGLK